jgi:hypothetical protein
MKEIELTKVHKYKKGILKNSSIFFVRKFGLSSGMKCPVLGNIIPVTLFATF